VKTAIVENEFWEQTTSAKTFVQRI